MVGDIIPNFFTLPNLKPDIFQAVDQAAHNAEEVFWSIIHVVDSQSTHDREKGFWMENHVDSNHEQDFE